MGDLFTLKTFGDWNRLGNILSVPNFTPILEKNIRVANKRIALEYRKKVRADVKSKKYARNARMTIEMKKGKATPLIDQNDMMASINIFEIDPYNVEVGIHRNVPRKDGKGKMWNLAVILHDGTTIKVTEKMRRYFEFQHRRGVPGWRPLSPSTSVIRIPPRPFFETPMKGFRTTAQKHWKEAIEASFKKA